MINLAFLGYFFTKEEKKEYELNSNLLKAIKEYKKIMLHESHLAYKNLEMLFDKEVLKKTSRSTKASICEPGAYEIEAFLVMLSKRYSVPYNLLGAYTLGRSENVCLESPKIYPSIELENNFLGKALEPKVIDFHKKEIKSCSSKRSFDDAYPISIYYTYRLTKIYGCYDVCIIGTPNYFME